MYNQWINQSINQSKYCGNMLLLYIQRMLLCIDKSTRWWPRAVLHIPFSTSQSISCRWNHQRSNGNNHLFMLHPPCSTFQVIFLFTQYFWWHSLHMDITQSESEWGGGWLTSCWNITSILVKNVWILKTK